MFVDEKQRFVKSLDEFDAFVSDFPLFFGSEILDTGVDVKNDSFLSVFLEKSI